MFNAGSKLTTVVTLCSSYLFFHQGYKPTAAKTVDEYAKLDANDESLARWKASLGITGEGGGDPTKRKVCVLVRLLRAHSYTCLS